MIGDFVGKNKGIWRASRTDLSATFGRCLTKSSTFEKRMNCEVKIKIGTRSENVSYALMIVNGRVRTPRDGIWSAFVVLVINVGPSLLGKKKCSAPGDVMSSPKESFVPLDDLLIRQPVWVRVCLV